MWTHGFESPSPRTITRIMFCFFVGKHELTLKVMDTNMTPIRLVFIENESTRFCNFDQFTAVCVTRATSCMAHKHYVMLCQFNVETPICGIVAVAVAPSTHVQMVYTVLYSITIYRQLTQTFAPFG
jgi:hypothetical protein